MGRIVTISLGSAMSIADSSPPILNMTICRFTGITSASRLAGVGAMRLSSSAGRSVQPALGGPGEATLVGASESHRPWSLASWFGPHRLIGERVDEIILH